MQLRTVSPMPQASTWTRTSPSRGVGRGRAGVHPGSDAVVRLLRDVKEALPFRGRLGADEDRPVDLSRVAVERRADLGDDDVAALEPALRRILRRQAAVRRVHRHRAQEGDPDGAAASPVRVLGDRDELVLRDARLRLALQCEDREVGQLGGAAQPLDLLRRLHGAQPRIVRRHVEELEPGQQLADAQVMLPRHPDRPRVADADEPDAAALDAELGEPRRDAVAGLVAAPLDDRHVADLAGVRHVVREADEECGVQILGARNDEVAVVHVEVLREPERIDVVVPVDARVAEEHERLELVLLHQPAREPVPPRHLVRREPHAASCSFSQSATRGRYLYGMLLQTWLPSSKRTHVALGAWSAIFFDSCHPTRRSSLPVTTSRGCSIRSATPSSESSNAFSRASSGFAAPEWCWNVSFVNDGRASHTSPKLNAPLTPATAFTRGSNAAARGA